METKDRSLSSGTRSSSSRFPDPDSNNEMRACRPHTIAISHVDCDEISLKLSRHFCHRRFIRVITKRPLPARASCVRYTSHMRQDIFVV